MKFKTQHKRVGKTGARDGFDAHRSGNITWKTDMHGNSSGVIKHSTVREAKAWMQKPV